MRQSRMPLSNRQITSSTSILVVVPLRVRRSRLPRIKVSTLDLISSLHLRNRRPTKASNSMSSQLHRRSKRSRASISSTSARTRSLRSQRRARMTSSRTPNQAPKHREVSSPIRDSTTSISTTMTATSWHRTRNSRRKALTSTIKRPSHRKGMITRLTPAAIQRMTITDTVTTTTTRSRKK